MPEQYSFNAGELTPLLYGKFDLDKYGSGCRILENFICIPHGPAVRRPGIDFIAPVKVATKKVVLVEFEFSTEQAYILEFGHNYIRVFKDGGQVESAPSTPYEVATTYTEAELPDLDFAQSADTLFIAHPNHPQASLLRIDHDDWDLNDIIFTDGPWGDENITAITLTPSAVTGAGITITASAAVFAATDVGRLVSINHSGTWGVARITAYTDTTHVTADVETDFGAITASETWKLGAWSDTTGYPRSVAFNDERLFWAGSPSFPLTLWGSKVGLYFDHGISSPLVATDALKLPLNTKQANAIRWLVSGRQFVTGTTGAEHWLTDDGGTGPMTPDSKQAVRGSAEGSSDTVKAIEAGNTIIFLKKHDKAIQELQYSFDTDAFAGEELTLLAEHLTEEYGIVSMAYQKSPYKIIWCVRADGMLMGMTYYKEHEVFGWHRHPTEGEVESVAVIPGDGQDEVWIAVKRTVDGATVRYVERLHSYFISDDTTDAFFVDSGLSLDNRQTVESIDFVDPGKVYLTAHGYNDGDPVRFRTVDEVVEGEETYLSLNNEEFFVAHKTADDFQLHDANGNDVSFAERKAVESATVALVVTAISGLSHLEGESVSIMADGAPRAEQTVASGALTLSPGASVIHIGLAYTSTLEIFPPRAKQGMGSPIRIAYVNINFHRTLGGKIGADEDNLNPILMTDDTVPAGIAAPLFSGIIEDISIDGGTFSPESRLQIVQDQPLPMTILGLSTRGGR